METCYNDRLPLGAPPEAEMKELFQRPIWYHSFDIPGIGKTTPAGSWDFYWPNIREVRSNILDRYKGAEVVDVGTFDGMWAFEAMQLGADRVGAYDFIDPGDSCECVRLAPMKFDLMARWFSKQYPKCALTYDSRCSVNSFDGSSQRITGGAEEFKSLNMVNFGLTSEAIVQFFGVLYHLQDPWRALRALRHLFGRRTPFDLQSHYTNPHAMGIDQTLFLETAIYDPENGMADRSKGAEVMMLNYGASAFYPNDPTTYCFLSYTALLRMLEQVGFDPQPEHVGFYHLAGEQHSRVALTTRAISMTRKVYI